MKKYLSLSLVALLLMSALVLTACGGGGSKADYSDSKYVGTWKAAGLAFGDESEELDDEYIMTLNADGTGTLAGGEDSSDFNWEPSDGGFKTSGSLKVDFVDDGDKIKTDIFGMELVFERQ